MLLVKTFIHIAQLVFKLLNWFLSVNEFSSLLDGFGKGAV